MEDQANKPSRLTRVDTSNRAAFLAELRRRLAVISPRTQLARFQLTAQIAQEFGLIFRAEIAGHAGLGASLLRSGFDLSVPFSINQNSSEGSVFTPREIALRFNLRSADPNETDMNYMSFIRFKCWKFIKNYIFTLHKKKCFKFAKNRLTESDGASSALFTGRDELLLLRSL